MEPVVAIQKIETDGVPERMRIVVLVPGSVYALPSARADEVVDRLLWRAREAAADHLYRERAHVGEFAHSGETQPPASAR